MAANWWDGAAVIGGAAVPAAPAPAPAASKWWEAAPVLGGAPAAAAAPSVNTVDAAVAGLGQGIRNVIDRPAEALAGVFSKVEADKVRAGNEANKASNTAQYGTSGAFKGGQLAGEVLTTLPVGGVLGAGAKAAGAAELGAAIASGGLRAGGGSLATRALGGAINAGATTAAIEGNDPSKILTNAAIGAAIPGAVRIAGAAGSLAQKAMRGPEVSPGIAKAAQAGADAGLVVPPDLVNPSLANRVLVGTAGKANVSQAASARNQEVLNQMARQTLGLADGTPLSLEALDAMRKQAGTAYADIAGLGALDARGARLPADAGVRSYTDALLQPKTEVVAAQLLETLKQRRNDATGFYRAYGRDASPDTLSKAKAAKADANAIESFLEDALQKTGRTDMLGNLRAAREQIAKTYSVEGVMNPATGNIDAAKLAKQLEKGKPLSGGLLEAARFAQAFPKAVQLPEKMSSVPGFSPLDVAETAGLTALTGNPLAALSLARRPLARAAALSGPIQRSLATVGESGARPQLTSGQPLSRLALAGRAAPGVLAGQDRDSKSTNPR